MINETRQIIDTLDSELVRLFEQRMNVISKIAQYKKAHGTAVRDSDREKDVIKKAQQQLANSDYAPYLTQFFEDLMRITREYQHHLIQKD